MEQTLSATPFDNRYSLLYKAAYNNGTIVRLILVRSSLVQLSSYISLYQALEEALPQEGEPDLLQIYLTLWPQVLEGYGFTPEDFILTYVSILTGNQVLEEPAFLKIITPEVFSLLQDFRSLTNQTTLSGPGGTGLIYEYNDWLRNNQTQQQRELLYLDIVSRNQADLEQAFLLPVSPLRFSRVTIRALPTFLSPVERSYAQAFNGTVIGADLADELFDGARVSFQVPVLIYTDSKGQTRSKIFSSFAFRNLLPLNPPARNNLFFLVWTGEVQAKATRETYTIGRYDLSVPELIVEAPVSPERNEDFVLQRIEANLPLLIGERNIFRTGGDFRIYNLNIVEPLFSDLLLNDPLFYSYFYIDEQNNAAFEKKKFSVHLRAIPITDSVRTMPSDVVLPSTVTATLVQYAGDGQPIIVENTEQLEAEEVNVPAGSPFVLCSITRANSAADARQFEEIFIRICRAYLDEIGSPESGGLLDIYKYVFPRASFSPVALKEKSQKISTKRLDQLKAEAPTIFGNGFARSCQGKRQPILIRDEDIPQWQAQTFLFKGAIHNRQVLRFPPNSDHPVNVVCPENQFPFPGLKPNEKEGQERAYPFVPCCGKTNQMDRGVSSNYNEYYHGIPKVHKSAARTLITTNKILKYPGGRGTLPLPLNSFLSSFFSSPVNLERRGVPRNVNSALACLILATNPGLNERDMIAQSSQKRAALAQLEPALLSQELYDLSQEEITAALINQETFFDPQLYYRALEESFAVNIFVFVSTGPNSSAFEIPRHLLFSARLLHRKRPTVFLFKNEGSESNNLTYPQIELLAFAGQSSALFPIDIADSIFRSYILSNSLCIWSSASLENGGNRSFNLIYQDISSPFTTADSQIIDRYGKCRGVNFSGLTVYFTPSAPLNLPRGEPHNNSLDSVLSLQLGPAAAASYEKERVVGLWYSAADFAYVYYFPISDDPRAAQLDLPPGPAPPFPGESQDSPVSEYNRLIFTRDVFLQLLAWFFISTVPRWPKNLPDIIPWFERNYLLIGQDEQSNYDFSSVVRVLPSLDSQSALNFLSSFPGLLRQGKIYLYNQRFARGVFYFLRELLRSYQPGELQPPKELSGVPFVERRGTLLLQSWSQTQEWRQEVPASFRLVIYDLLVQKLALSPEPYIYVNEAPQEGLYLIQNIADLGQALQIARTWKEERVNLGNRAQSRESSGRAQSRESSTEEEYQIFTIGNDGKLSFLSGQGDLALLRYDNGSYGVILPLP